MYKLLDSSLRSLTKLAHAPLRTYFGRSIMASDTAYASQGYGSMSRFKNQRQVDAWIIEFFSDEEKKTLDDCISALDEDFNPQIVEIMVGSCLTKSSLVSYPMAG